MLSVRVPLWEDTAGVGEKDIMVMERGGVDTARGWGGSCPGFGRRAYELTKISGARPVARM